jgi:hypothetical protein
LPSKIEEILQIEKTGIPNEWHRLKFDELSGDLPMAWLHESLKNLEIGKFLERYIGYNNRYSP